MSIIYTNNTNCSLFTKLFMVLNFNKCLNFVQKKPPTEVEGFLVLNLELS